MNINKTLKTIVISISPAVLLILLTAFSRPESDGVQEPPKLQNPVTVDYIKENLRKSSPRLVLTPAI